MKIAFNALSLQPHHKGGAESVFINLVKGFVINGLAESITYFCYPEMAKRVSDLSPKSSVITINENVSEKHARISVDMIQTRTFHRIYKNYNFDIILFANAEIGLFHYDIPTIVIPHDIQNVSRPEINKSKFQFYLNYFSYKNCFKKADRIIAISDVDKAEIEQYYPFTQKKTIKIYDPIDVSSSVININANKDNFILAVNIQYPHKNIETLLKAFSSIHRIHPKLRLKLAGAKNAYTNTLESMAKALEIDDYVDFLGFISKDYLAELWSTARLYVNPSIFEGFGMTSVESIMFGAPTLLSDLEVNREVTDNLCEYYSNYTDYNCLADKITHMLSKPFDIDRANAKANTLKERYRLENISKQYIDLINSMTL